MQETHQWGLDEKTHPLPPWDKNLYKSTKSLQKHYKSKKKFTKAKLKFTQVSKSLQKHF